MAGLNVGSISVGMNVDLAEFQRGMTKATDVARSNTQNMSVEMKRSAKEGGESLRIIDEMLGIHISRPIVRIVSQEFPQLAKAFQSLLGAGVVLGVVAAAFDVIMRGVERVTKAIEDAKKAQLEFIETTHKLQMAINEQSISTANSLDQIKQKLADLSGDKGGALAAQLRIITRSDADAAVKAIDAISEAYLANAKAAAEAASMSTRFWAAAGHLATSPLDSASEKIRNQSKEIKNTFEELATSDPLHGLEKGASFLTDELTKAKKAQADMQGQELSGLDAMLAKISFMDNIVAHRGAVTKETVIQQNALVASLQKQLEITNAQIEIDKGKRKVAAAESAAQPEVGSKEIEKLKADTSAQLALAGATTQSTAAQRLQTASGEASQLISRILEEAHGRLTARIKEEITTIHALTAERQVAKDAITTNQELDKQLTSTENQITSERKLALAYRESSDAVLSAKVEEKLAPQIQAAQTLREEYERLKKAADDYASSVQKLGGAAGPKEGIKGITAEALTTAKTAADSADQKVAQLQIQATAEARQKYQVDIESNGAAITAEKPLLDNLNVAYLQGAEAVRHAQVALSLYHYEQAHPGATPDQISAVSAQLEAQSLQARRNSDAELAARYSISRAYEDEINQLTRAKEVLQQYGQSTLAIDAQIYDAQLRNIQQWDDAALKVGTFGQKTHAVFNELVIQGKQAGEQIARAFGQAIGDAETQLAKALTGQKADFKGVVTNLAEQATKAKIQEGVGALAEKFGFGDILKGKPDGTKSNPLFVQVLNAAAGAGGNAGSVIGASGGGEGGGIASGLLSFFGGFRASGGDLTPGKAYVVGEQGPELLAIPHAGSITSNADMRKMTVSNHRGGDVRNTNITQNFGNARDADMFRRTVRQENARMFRNLR